MNRNNFNTLLSLVLIGLVIGGTSFALAKKTKKPIAKATNKTKATPFTASSKTTLMDPSQRPFAVVVENHTAARPQSGLSQADVVYEALAEGGITRFLAIFQTHNVNNIGPVRSARTYFNDWAQEYNAIFAHVGGNSDALELLKQGVTGVSNADQFFNDSYFWRTTDRKMPHNVYTSTVKLNALAQAHGFSTEKNYSDFIYKDQQGTSNQQTIDIKFSGMSTNQYVVKYVYDTTTNTYKRYNAGKPSIDADNKKQIAPKNIVVQYVRNWPVQSDTILAISMATREGGNAVVFQDGKQIPATWKWDGSRTRYYDSNNNEISFDHGQIFIEIVPPEFPVSVK